jgi:hypothetical protein
LTDASHATPGPLPPPPPRRHGCLNGCLVAAGIVFLVLLAGGGGIWWYMTSGYKNNETLKAATVELNQDQTARSVLGDNIEITGLSGTHYATDLANGTSESYVAHLKGSKAEGDLAVDAETPPHGQRHFTKLILTGPDGKTYDLLHASEGTPGAI